ncbi:acyltransferase family protein [Mammaliicoccus sciuri]|uniref:acyltransferase family protein n=1 Tax=Mammaliicoccus sciuri TaxID=1296 RepID=UPI000E68ED29|nr:acyltransferase family protein [Mammaliicoccus sciuri]RIO09168.1 adhesin [Mammaliicoccus sciuri]
MKKTILYEIYWLRTIACLAVVGVHAITSGLILFPEERLALSGYSLYTIQMALMFGTPAFIFISEFLFAKSYPDGLPEGFFKKRVQYLLIPYFSMSIIYGIVFAENWKASTIIVNTLQNLFLGNFVAYFIPVIFQFYILHALLHKNLQKWTPQKVFILAFIINALYLAYFQATEPPISQLEYFWNRGHWILLPAWLFYFVLGYYSGHYHEKLIEYLKKYKFLVFIAPMITLAIVIILRYLGLPDLTSSKRVDIIFYTTSLIFLIIYLTSKLKTAPKIVLFISKYSFSIYLLHKLLIDNIVQITNNIYLHTLITFVLGILFSIFVSYLFNKIPYGQFIVGKVAKIPVKK